MIAFLALVVLFQTLAIIGFMQSDKEAKKVIQAWKDAHEAERILRVQIQTHRMRGEYYGPIRMDS